MSFFHARAVLFATVTRGAGLLGQKWVGRFDALMTIGARVDVANIFAVEWIARQGDKGEEQTE